MINKQLLILFIIFWSQNSSCFVNVLFKIVQETWDFGGYLHTSRPSSEYQMASLFADAVENEDIVERLEYLNEEFEYFKRHAIDEENKLPSWWNQFTIIDSFNPRTEELSFLTKTKDIWNTFNAHLKNRSTEEAYDQLANKILDSLGYHLGDFRAFLAPSPLLNPEPDKGLFMAVALKERGYYHTRCDQGETFQDTAVRLFQSAILTEIKVHILMSFAYLLKFDKDLAWKTPLRFLKEDFREQFIRYIDVLQKSLGTVESPYIRTCSPAVRKRDVDYYEFDGLFQQTIYRKSKCSSGHSFSCSDLAAGKGDKYGCSIFAINQHTSCNGTLYRCEDLHGSTPNASVCLSNQSHQKIRFVEYKGKTVGTDIVSTCPKEDYHRFSEMDSSNTVCSCQCRFTKWKLLLKLMLSRVHSNYVIVGLRIHKVENYIYIQIAEGKLEANGYIANYSWVNSTRTIHPEWGGNKDIVRVNMHRRTFFLDDLQLESGYVLTGVHFTEWPFGHRPYSLTIMGTKFDYETGKLYPKHRYHANSHLREPNNELKFPKKRRPDVGALGHPYVTDSTNYTHVNLQQSDLSDDFGQSTLPSFEAIDVLTNPLLPIGGVGLFHKGYEFYAGYLALRLYPIKYSSYMDEFRQTHNLYSLETWKDPKK